MFSPCPDTAMPGFLQCMLLLLLTLFFPSCSSNHCCSPPCLHCIHFFRFSFTCSSCYSFSLMFNHSTITALINHNIPMSILFGDHFCIQKKKALAQGPVGWTKISGFPSILCCARESDLVNYLLFWSCLHKKRNYTSCNMLNIV